MAETKAELEQALKAQHASVGAVQLRSGITAYFRRPTQEEYDTFQALAIDGGEARRVAFNRYVRGCFCGSWPESTLDEIVAIEGPGVVGGPCGTLVNELAGITERPTRML